MAHFNILMFGARRTGKSSILASMIESFNEVNKSSVNKINLKATKETKILLENKKEKLEEIFEKYKNKEIFDIQEQPTDLPYPYEFIMSAEGSKDSHTIKFIDIPGEWLMTESKMKELDENISSSQIIIIAIDTPHLMEEDGCFSKPFNRVKQVDDFLKCVKGEKDIPRMILFVPVKCEKYFHEGRMEEVNKKIKEQYSTLFKIFSTDTDKKELYTVAITPILTLGGVIFHDFLRDSDGFVEEITNVNVPSLAFTPKQTFYKFYDKAPSFRPKYCEQPVLYLLNFILKFGKMTKMVEQDKSLPDRIIDGLLTIVLTPLAIILGEFKWLMEMWGEVFRDKALIESAITASEHIKTSGDGYEIIQNPF